MAQDMLFEWAEKDPQPTVAKLCACLEAADLSKLAQGVMDKVNKGKFMVTALIGSSSDCGQIDWKDI